LLAGARVDLARYATPVKQDSIANQTYADEGAQVKQDEGTVLLDQGVVATAQVNLNWCPCRPNFARWLRPSARYWTRYPRFPDG
jgi:multidrug efflux system membrane fusion protein